MKRARSPAKIAAAQPSYPQLVKIHHVFQCVCQFLCTKDVLSWMRSHATFHSLSSHLKSRAVLRDVSLIDAVQSLNLSCSVLVPGLGFDLPVGLKSLTLTDLPPDVYVLTGTPFLPKFGDTMQLFDPKDKSESVCMHICPLPESLVCLEARDSTRWHFGQQLPSSLQKCQLEIDFLGGNWPSTLRELTLGITNRRCETLPPWPSQLTFLSLRICKGYARPLPPFPSDLVHLRTFFGDSSKLTIPAFPGSLKELWLEINSRQRLPTFPEQLNAFSLYSHDAEDISLPPFPPRLKQCRLYGTHNSCPIFAAGLTHLTLGNYLDTLEWNAPLPSTLQKLKFLIGTNTPKSQQVPLENPETLHTLKVFSLNQVEGFEQLRGLTKLTVAKLTQSIARLPALKKLVLVDDGDPEIDFNDEIEKLPAQLTSLKLNPSFNNIIRTWPTALSKLSFGRDYQRVIAVGMAPLPASVRTLSFPKKYDQPILFLPRSLTSLRLGSGHSNLLPRVWPESLRTLWISASHPHLPPFPPSLKYVVLLKSSQEELETLRARFAHCAFELKD